MVWFCSATFGLHLLSSPCRVLIEDDAAEVSMGLPQSPPIAAPKQEMVLMGALRPPRSDPPGPVLSPR
ncbi:MAG: hypothetical protein BIP78_1341 [Candidatus Bipolaricaulis sibiricus]|uniref:Uncharacterized protein n=1 Tax=Bipolaricaulis sibiricus TaxID=2501609 RepID=A0A410FVL2_BIPS1|nr:MAG: hypothetical protein BIP78_1341 [Candidatus Bipolaricaulis sibiricus]